MHFNCEVVAAGAVATDKGLVKPNFSPAMASGSAFNRHVRAWKAVLLGGLLLLFGWRIAKGQDTVKVNLADYGFYLSVPDTLLDTGESVTVEVGSTESCTAVTELWVDLELGAAAAQSPVPNPDLRGSWAFGSAAQTQLQSGILRINQNLAPPQTGSGKLFSLELVSTQDNVPAAALLSASGGGAMVIIDDIGYKQRPVLSPSMCCYPNPAGEWLHFSGPALQSWQLYGSDGRQIAQAAATDLAHQEWWIGDLPPGLYLARWSTATAQGQQWIEHR